MFNAKYRNSLSNNYVDIQDMAKKNTKKIKITRILNTNIKKFNHLKI